MKTSAIITAAGDGRRMTSDNKKQFLKLGEVPLIVHSLQTFQDSNWVDEIILVAPEKQIEYCTEEIVGANNLTKVKKIVPGGEKRQESVFNGLQSVSGNSDLVAVHDGVRPFLSSFILEKAIKEAGEKDAVVVAIPVKDTIKKISSSGVISEGVSREALQRIQTPQVFKKDILVRAFENARKDDFYGPDESTLVSRLGVPVYLVAGSELNIKITTPDDLLLGEAILMCRNFKSTHDYADSNKKSV